MVSGDGPLITVPASSASDENASDSSLSSPYDSMQGFPETSEHPADLQSDLWFHEKMKSWGSMNLLYSGYGWDPRGSSREIPYYDGETMEIGSEAWIESLDHDAVARHSRSYTSDLDPKIEVLLVDSEPKDDPPKPQPAPFNPPAPKRSLTLRSAKITDEEADEPTLKLEAAAENLVPELENDL